MPRSFLDLPAELRNQIYSETLPKTKTICIRNGLIVVHPLLLVSRQVRHEYHPFHEAHVEEAEEVEADVIDWDFWPVNVFFETSRFHELGGSPKLHINLILSDSLVAFDREAFRIWFRDSYRVPRPSARAGSSPLSSRVLPPTSAGGSSLFSGGVQSLFSNSGPSLFSSAPLFYNGGGSPLLTSRWPGAISIHDSVEMTVKYDLKVDWNSYSTTSLERLIDQIEIWYPQYRRSLFSRAQNFTALVDAMRQTLEIRRDWMVLEAYKCFLTNSKPTRWPGIDDGIGNDVEMKDIF